MGDWKRLFQDESVGTDSNLNITRTFLSLLVYNPIFLMEISRQFPLPTSRTSTIITSM